MAHKKKSRSALQPVPEQMGDTDQLPVTPVESSKARLCLNTVQWQRFYRSSKQLLQISPAFQVQVMEKMKSATKPLLILTW